MDLWFLCFIIECLDKFILFLVESINVLQNIINKIGEFFASLDFNAIGAYLKDSKDVIIALLAVIFTIYIPFLLYFYQEINGKDKFKYLDLYIFHKNVFNLRKIFGVIIFLIIILLFWNTSDFSDYYWINIIILLISIFPFGFFINNLFELYELNENLREEKKSKNIIELRLNSIKNLKLNQENFYIFKDILQNKNLENYNFTHNFFKIFLKKILQLSENIGHDNWNQEIMLRDYLSVYKNYNEDINSLRIFSNLVFENFLYIYKKNYNNKFLHLSDIITDTIILKIEQIISQKYGNEIYQIIENLKSFLKDKENNFQYKFLSDFHSKILKSEIIGEDFDFMEKYGREIFDEYKEIFYKEKINNGKFRVSGKLQNQILRKLINIVKYNKSDYEKTLERVLEYWLLDFEPNLFVELLVLYFVGHGETKANSILENDSTIGGIYRIMETGPGEKTFEEQERKLHKNTIENFYETFKNNVPNFDELISQFQKLEKNEKLSERDILKSKSYINLLRKLKEITKKHEK